MIGTCAIGDGRWVAVLVASVLLVTVVGAVIWWTAVRDVDIDGLAEGREKWADRGLETYVVEYTTGGQVWGPTVSVTVLDGQVVFADYDMIDALGRPDAWSVPDLFDEIDDGPVVAADFHAADGYPLGARFDPVPEGMDDEWGFTVSTVRELSTVEAQAVAGQPHRFVFGRGTVVDDSGNQRGWVAYEQAAELCTALLDGASVCTDLPNQPELGRIELAATNDGGAALLVGVAPDGTDAVRVAFGASDRVTTAQLGRAPNVVLVFAIALEVDASSVPVEVRAVGPTGTVLASQLLDLAQLD